MKNIVIIALIVALFTFVVIKSESTQTEYLRIHIQSNSLSEKDENAKFLVKDKLNNLLAEIIVNTSSKQQLMQVLSINLESLTDKINDYLLGQGFNYLASISLNNEYFPTRSYEGYVVDSGFYDALIVKLGAAKGDNWWCVLYPPLCVSESGTTAIKSRIKNIIESFFNKKESV